jgi:UPF0176 protein
MLHVATFYHFTTLDDLTSMRERLLALGGQLALKGTVLLAPEGLNATICGPRAAIDEFLTSLASDGRFGGMSVKYSRAAGDAPVFLRFKVKLKSEIVTMGVPGVDVREHTAEHVAPQAFNTLLNDPAVAVLDVRNRYETEIGSFAGAEDPGTASFREFPEYVAERFGADRDQPVAMFCTGGIRCEKASAYLVEQGFTKVYQLDGGILRYLEEVPQDESLWHGDCFVFDQRVTVDHDLQPGGHVQCFACRRPVAAAELSSPHYQEGVSCPACFGEKTEDARAAYRERQRQMDLASHRGRSHLGPEAQPADDAGSD